MILHGQPLPWLLRSGKKQRPLAIIEWGKTWWRSQSKANILGQMCLLTSSSWLDLPLPSLPAKLNVRRHLRWGCWNDQLRGRCWWRGRWGLFHQPELRELKHFLILALLVVGVSQNTSSSSTIPLNGRRVGGWRTKKKPETLEGLKYLSFV